MQVSDAKRVGALTDEEKKAQPHLDNLPEDTHIVSGTLEGHGAVSLASEKALISAKVVKLERTISGGIDYQLAIFVSEPVQMPVAEVKPVEDPNYLAAVAYFVVKGLSEADARKKVNQFGVERVLAAREKELDQQLAETLAQPPAPTDKG